MGTQGTELYEGLAVLHWSSLDSIERERDHELGIMRQAIVRYGEPALEIGSGSGHLLLPLREQGYHVDGCDLSLELLVRCRKQALQRGVTVDLYWQAMQELDLPRRYRTILVPGGAFLHVVDRGEALEALRRFHDHLLPGGALSLVLRLDSALHLAPDNPPGAWRRVEALPQTAKGTSLLVEERRLASDRLEQVITTQRRYRLCVGMDVAHEETRSGEYRWYGKYELLVMLAWAGFQKTEVQPLSAGEQSGRGLHGQVPMRVTAHRRPTAGMADNH